MMQNLNNELLRGQMSDDVGVAETQTQLDKRTGKTTENQSTARQLLSIDHKLTKQASAEVVLVACSRQEHQHL